MIYVFRSEDLLTGELRATRRIQSEGLDQYAEFVLANVAPTENLRIVIYDDDGRHFGEILLLR